MLSTDDLCARFSKMATGVNGGISTTAGPMESEEVRTLFVSGLPMDVRLRELYLLFRSYPGYEGSFLKLISSKPGKQPQPIAFVSFKSRKQAEKALEELQGVRFDPASTQTLRLEFARTNSRVSPRQPVPPLASTPHSNYYQSYSQHKNGTCYYIVPNAPAAMAHQQAQAMAGASSGQYANGWSHRINMPMTYQSISHSPSPTLSPAPSHPHLSVLNFLSDSDSSYSPPPPMYYTGPMPASSPTPAPPFVNVQLPPPVTTPCSTLFVANLELQHTEDEIANLFSSCEGYIRAKMFSRGGPPVAFVEFKDVECAAQAMEKLQGVMLVTSKRNSGIRIEYAKHRMGEQPSRTPSSSDTNSSPPSPTVQLIHSSNTPPLSLSHTHSPAATTPTPHPLTTDFNPQCPSPSPQPFVGAGGTFAPQTLYYPSAYTPQQQIQQQMFLSNFTNPALQPWHIGSAVPDHTS